MEKHQHNFNVAFPLSVNADHQMVEIIHKEIDPLDDDSQGEQAQA